MFWFVRLRLHIVAVAFPYRWHFMETICSGYCAVIVIRVVIIVIGMAFNIRINCGSRLAATAGGVSLDFQLAGM